MGFFEKFPFANLHELNLDWIIKKFNEWGIQAEENIRKATEASQTAGQQAGEATNMALAAKNSAEIAQEAASMAKDASEGAEARAQNSAEDAAAAAVSATNAETAAENAELNATAARNAAESALEAAAQSWPYIYSDSSGVYRLNTVEDPVTISNKIYMVPPSATMRLFAVDYPFCLNLSGLQVHPYCINVHFTGTEYQFSQSLTSLFSRIDNIQILGVYVKRFLMNGVAIAPGASTPVVNAQVSTNGVLSAIVTPNVNTEKDIWIQIFVKGGSVG